MIASEFTVIPENQFVDDAQMQVWDDMYAIYCETMLYPRSPYVSKLDFLDSFDRDSHQTYVARRAGETIGMAVIDLDYEMSDPTDLYLDLFATKYPGIGDGSTFLTILEDQLAAFGARRIELFPRERARRFYHRQGYRVVPNSAGFMAHRLKQPTYA